MVVFSSKKKWLNEKQIRKRIFEKWKMISNKVNFFIFWLIFPRNSSFQMMFLNQNSDLSSKCEITMKQEKMKMDSYRVC